MPSSYSPRLHGSCACGKVAYFASAPPTHLDCCYCLTSGAPFVAWMGIAKTNLIWSATGIRTFRLAPFSSRGCCEDCGGTLFMQYDCYPGKTHVAAGTIVDFPDEWTMPMFGTHIFVRSKPMWYTIPEDGVKQWQDWDEVFRTNFPDVVKAWEAGETGG